MLTAITSGPNIQLDGLEVEVEADGVGPPLPYLDASFKYRVRVRAEDGYVYETSASWGDPTRGDKREYEAVGWLVLLDLWASRNLPPSPPNPWSFLDRWLYRSAWRENAAHHEKHGEAARRLAHLLDRNGAKIEEADDQYELSARRNDL